MAESGADFTFGLYPELDAELEAAFERNILVGAGGDPGEAGLVAAVQGAVDQSTAETAFTMSPEAEAWLNPSLQNAALSWWSNDGLMRQPPPGQTPAEFFAAAPDKALPATFERLFEAKTDIEALGKVTPSGEALNMNLTLIPWKTFRERLADFDDFIRDLRTNQGVAGNDDYFNPNLLAAIQNDEPLYRDPEAPSNLLRPSEYLDRMIERDGDWGAMLTQVNGQAGIQDWVGNSPNQLTGDGITHLSLEDHVVDGLGVFEWLTLTFSVRPDQLSTEDFSWMLANRLDIDGGARVPLGFWRGGRVRSDLYWASNQDGDLRPRLAVI